MKEQVTDISKVLQDMTEEMRLMRETINQQYAEIVKLNRNIDAQNLQIRKKDKEIEKLLERLSKYENPDKNSDNSSTPPSKERMKDEIVRRTRTLRKSSGKKPGGQNRHEGHQLSCSSTPDVVIDDIPSYCNKRLDWAWIAQTVCYTLLFRAEGRGSKVLTDKFGDALERMTAVTDRHSAYFVIHFLDHQVCLAHLLRELQYLSDLNAGQDWSEKVAGLFREAFHERNSRPEAVIDKVPWTERLDRLLKQSVENLGKKFVALKKGLIKCRDYIFNFLEDPIIPSDNNGSEQGIRKVKIKLNNSRTFRSEFGADAFLELHSVIETAKKHGKTAQYQ